MLVASVTILMLALLALGMPVGFAMGISGVLGLYLYGGLPLVMGILDTAPLSTVSSFELITVPMFLLMAELVLLSGVTDDLFKAAAAWLGRIRGGLGMSTALTGAGFAAICGSSTGSAATLAATTVPAMIKNGYDPKVAGGVAAISGTLAILIPPSVGLVVYGFMTNISVAKLFMAGVIPGILVMAVIMATVWLIFFFYPKAAPLSPVVPLREKLRLLPGILPVVALFGFITLSIYTGIATPTEASAVAALGALVLVIARGRLTLAGARHAFRRAALTTCMIMTIILCAHVFGYFVTITRLTHGVIGFVGGLNLAPWIILLIILTGYVILGMFMNQMAILVLTVPIVAPLMVSLSYDPIWFGIIFILVAEIGMVTPPRWASIALWWPNTPTGRWERCSGAWPRMFWRIFSSSRCWCWPPNSRSGCPAP